MTADVEVEFVHQPLYLLAQARNAARRRSKGRRSPDAGMDRQLLDLAFVSAPGSDEQVERHAPVHARKLVRFDDEQFAVVRIAPVEPGKGALDRTGRQDFGGVLAADTDRLLSLVVARLDDVPELGQHSAIEPFEQRPVTMPRQAFGIVLHGVLQFGPVANRGGDVFQRFAQGLRDGAAQFRIDAARLDIDHRFVHRFVRLAVGQFLKRAILAAPNGHDRMHQPVDRQSIRGDGRGNGVHDEGHVVIDDRDPRVAPFFGRRSQSYGGLAEAAVIGRLEDELRCLAHFGVGEGIVARQHRILDPVDQLFDQLVGNFRRILRALCGCRPAVRFGTHSCGSVGPALAAGQLACWRSAPPGGTDTNSYRA